MLIITVCNRIPSAWLGMALMIGFLSFGGEFLDPRIQTLLLVFCVLPKRSPQVAATLRPRTEPTLA
jgi:hypothetical protein